MSDEEKTTKRKTDQDETPSKKFQKKSSSDFTRAEFLAVADDIKNLEITEGGLLFDNKTTIQLQRKVFATKSCGWGVNNGRVLIPVGDGLIAATLSLNCIIHQSKEWEDGKDYKAEEVTRTQSKNDKHKQPALTKSEFDEKSKGIKGKLGSTKVTIEPRQFATGSCGWYSGQKVLVNIGDKTVNCQLTGNIVAIGSKSWKD